MYQMYQINIILVQCYLSTSFEKLFFVQTAFLKTSVYKTINILRLLKLPFWRQAAQQAGFVDLEAAAVSREAQTVGAPSVIQEADPHHLPVWPGWPRTWESAQKREPLSVHLLIRTTPGGCQMALQSKPIVGLTSPLTTEWWLAFLFNPNAFFILTLKSVCV